jgi:hypothetical protein
MPLIFSPFGAASAITARHGGRQLAARVNAEFGVNVGQMGFHGGYRDRKGYAAGDERETDPRTSHRTWRIWTCPRACPRTQSERDLC